MCYGEIETQSFVIFKQVQQDFCRICPIGGRTPPVCERLSFILKCFMIASELVGDEKIGKIGRPNKMWHYTPEKENLQIRIKRLTDDNSDGEESTVDEEHKIHSMRQEECLPELFLGNFMRLQRNSENSWMITEKYRKIWRSTTIRVNFGTQEGWRDIGWWIGFTNECLRSVQKQWAIKTHKLRIRVWKILLNNMNFWK